ncbi:MAG: hypothetical protein LBJ62_03795, partial [Bifidobacteriaceae bacterium]|jgi:hypothetical protein|nr:hypothetical protein [Bifidobacteriaceae bacterium]
VSLPDGVTALLYQGDLMVPDGSLISARSFVEAISEITDEAGNKVFGHAGDTVLAQVIEHSEFDESIRKTLGGTQKQIDELMQLVRDGDIGGDGNFKGKRALIHFLSERYVRAIKSVDVIVICPGMMDATVLPNQVLYKTELLRFTENLARSNG